MDNVFKHVKSTIFKFANSLSSSPLDLIIHERMKDGNLSPDLRLIKNAELMETMFNLIGQLRESHALFINGQHLEWNALLLRLYHIHCCSDAIVEVIPLTELKIFCDSGVIVDNKHERHPADDIKYVKKLLTQNKRYSHFAFRRFEDNLIVMEVQMGNHICDLLMIDLRPYSPGKTGVTQYLINL
jgi:hypothetical protein